MKSVNSVQSQGGGKYEIDTVILKLICNYKPLNTWHQCISVGRKRQFSKDHWETSYYPGRYKAETLPHSLHYNTSQIIYIK